MLDDDSSPHRNGEGRERVGVGYSSSVTMYCDSSQS